MKLKQQPKETMATQPRKPAGKVAVVTGASKGIGAAIKFREKPVYATPTV
jgi:hypothetical protein